MYSFEIGYGQTIRDEERCINLSDSNFYIYFTLPIHRRRHSKHFGFYTAAYLSGWCDSNRKLISEIFGAFVSCDIACVICVRDETLLK